MSEYIKKSDARKAIRVTCKCLNYLTPSVMQLTTAIDNAPSADVVEVKHGKWIDDEGQQVLMENDIAKGENWKVCSNCGAGTCIGAKYKTDRCYHPFFQSYCPNCGAKMDNAYEDVKEQERESDKK